MKGRGFFFSFFGVVAAAADVPRLAKASGLFLHRELIVCIITHLFLFFLLLPYLLLLFLLLSFFFLPQSAAATTSGTPIKTIIPRCEKLSPPHVSLSSLRLVPLTGPFCPGR